MGKYRWTEILLLLSRYYPGISRSVVPSNAPIVMRMRNRPSSVHPLSIEEVFVLLQQIKEVIQEYLAYSSVVRPIIFWNLTGRCNLSCQHCYNSSGPDLEADTELSTKEALSFIDDCAELSVPVILFSGGEPLLRPDL